MRFLGFKHGLLSGYVAGARGKSRRAIIQPGNRVQIILSQRTSAQLASAKVELLESRALIAFTPGPANLLNWITQLTAAALAEQVPHPKLATALDALLTGLDAGLDRRKAAAALAQYELLLLAESGLGLDLSACALGGAANQLTHVSPKTGRAVSDAQVPDAHWRAKLLPLPALFGGADRLAHEEEAALRLTGHFITRHFTASHLTQIRERAVKRLLSKPPADALRPCP